MNKELVELVKKYAVKYGEFTLSSGKKSNYFIDMSKVTNRSDGLRLIMLSLMQSFLGGSPNIQAVGGPVLGAAPIVGGLVALSKDPLLNGFLVRKEEKNGEIIEGVLNPGDNVIVVEDVVTTGAQVKRAVDIIEAKGGVVRLIIAVLDRLEGAKELLGDRFCSLMTIDDLDIKS